MGLFDKQKTVEEPKYEPRFKISFPTTIPVLPDARDPTKIDVRYAVIEPFVKIHIYWSAKDNEILYDVEEPVLSDAEKAQLKLIEDGLTELINISFITTENERVVIEFLEKNVLLLLNELAITLPEETFLNFMYFIYRDFIGLGRLEPLMRDYFIEDVECNGYNYPIYIVHRKYRNLKTNITFPEIKELARFVEKLAQKCSQYVSYASPLLDGSLPDGSRVNATYTEDVTTRGPTMTIRKFTKEPWTPIKLMDFRTVSPEILAYLWLLIENKSSIIVIGGTGSGKTSFINAMAFFIPPAARVVSIEDTREINLMHENWLPAVARAGAGTATITGEKHGEVSLFDLLRESLRQRPDYIIVGEVRGKEAYVLFQAMASGHPSYSTFHADSVDTLIKRLETAPISLSPSLIEAVDAVCMITPSKVKGKDVRRLREITELIAISSTGEPKVNVPFVWDPATDKFLFKTQSVVLEKIMKRTGMTWKAILQEFQNRAMLLYKMYQQKIFGFQEVQEIINEYYKVPEKVLKRFGIK
ncbi:type II/IV secretion system ATPase subunit [Candidatus Woesearchaeota archaeon]|nr:type II/IV secretion system ATPase subunit [Candidatus Woesearchaeota archaeon]